MMLMKPLKTKHQLRCFIGVVNLYWYLWKNQSQLLDPLSKTPGENICGYKQKSKINLSMKLKNCNRERNVIVSKIWRTIQFTYWREGSKTWIIIITRVQTSRIFRKLAGTQKRYTNTIKELLIIVETIKYFFAILLHNNIMVYNDH